MYRMDEQQGPTVEHGELHSVSYANHNEKEYTENVIKADPFPEILLTMLNTEDKEKHPVSI